MAELLNALFLNPKLPADGRKGELIYEEVDGCRVALSHYEDMEWKLPNALCNNNLRDSKRKIIFRDNSYVNQQKQFALRWLNGKFNRKLSSSVEGVKKLNYFLSWLNEKHNALSLNKVTLFTIQQYVGYRKQSGKGRRGGGASPETIRIELDMVKLLSDTLSGTESKFENPFIETSTAHVAGLTDKDGARKSFKTNYIPFPILTKVFQWAESTIDTAEVLLASNPSLIDKTRANPLYELRKACLFVLMITTGMRVHEIAYIQSNAIKTMGDENSLFYILSSKSSKTMGTGFAEDCCWYAPEIAVRAVKILEHIAKPMQEAAKIKIRELKASRCGESLVQAKRIESEVVNSLLASYSLRTKTFNVLSDDGLETAMKSVFKKLQIDWKFSNHQTRRTYARLVAKHTFGDLRILVEQMKHASMDMTAGYGHDDSVDLSLLQNIDPELRELIEEEFGMVVAESKLEVATATHLSGGAGRNLVRHRHKTEKWRKNGIAVKTYDDKDLAQILETTPLFGRGHAYCMNDQGPCDSFDCVNCDSGVITLSHLDYWKALWQQQNELLAMSENNPQIKAVVEYNQRSARQVFSDLGVDMNEVESVA
tara:strand:+ start:215 stop:2002 length:1788 start_codon:yes stop_codon:yes gene_type:complete